MFLFSVSFLLRKLLTSSRDLKLRLVRYWFSPVRLGIVAKKAERRK